MPQYLTSKLAFCVVVLSLSVYIKSALTFILLYVNQSSCISSVVQVFRLLKLKVLHYELAH